MRLQILDQAEADLLAGYNFYEAQSPGLGSYFLETLYSDIESLRLFAGVHRRVFGFYRLLSKRFPFAVYYDCKADLVSVWRVLDCRQEPRSIKSRLKKPKRRAANE